MTNKTSEVTTIAVFGERLEGIRKTVEATAKSVEEIKTARYVTQNEMQVAIKAAADEITRDFTAMGNGLGDKINGTNKILWLIASTFLIAVVGAFAKLVLKI